LPPFVAGWCSQSFKDGKGGDDGDGDRGGGGEAVCEGGDGTSTARRYTSSLIRSRQMNVLPHPRASCDGGGGRDISRLEEGLPTSTTPPPPPRPASPPIVSSPAAAQMSALALSNDYVRTLREKEEHHSKLPPSPQRRTTLEGQPTLVGCSHFRSREEDLVKSTYAKDGQTMSQNRRGRARQGAHTHTRERRRRERPPAAKKRRASPQAWTK